MVRSGEMLWEASKDRVDGANLTQFITWLADRGQAFDGYADLWDWSVTDLDGFWRAVWDYFDIIHDGQINEVVTAKPMPHTRWFTGTQLNYAENVLRNETQGDPDRVMMHHCSELRPMRQVSWAEFGNNVRRLATKMRNLGLGPGDRVVAYMPNIPETVIAMLATTAIGAAWSSAAPEFGAQTVTDRFAQIEPSLIFAINGYRYGGKDYDRIDDLQKITNDLPTARHLVMLDYLPDARQAPVFGGQSLTWDALLAGPNIKAEDFEYERVASDHPLWILFSSGTTGLPKPIVQGHHGILLEHYKAAAFHFEVPADGTAFFYSTTGWMVWNTLMWGPLMNARTMLYDGHPAFPDARLLWQIAEQTNVTTMAVNPTFLQIVRQQNIVPRDEFSLTSLKSLMVVGSPATPELFAWVHDAVKPDIWMASQSGGTEFCSGILSGTPLLPTRAGEIQAPGLGVKACAFDEDGQPVVGDVGELMITKPMPSMPLFFWGDSDFSRYNASYFENFPGIWQHGDRVLFNDHGGSFVLGRSDATLNRYGVRIGSSEIYRTVETFPQIVDSLIICIEEPDGGFFMPLFVQMADGQSLSPELRREITDRLRVERSPRHIPDEINATPAIPTTLTGKKMEVPVRKLLMGQALEQVASKDATRNPDALDWFAEFAAERRASSRSRSIWAL